MPCDECNKKSLTSALPSGTVREGARSAAPSDRKNRRPQGATANSLADFILVLHSFARDWAEVATDADERYAAGLLTELAALLKKEYDIRHG